MVADSLITWSDGRHSLEPKLFAHHSEPQVVGYCGDRDWGIDLCKHLLNTVSTNVDEGLFLRGALQVLAVRVETLPCALHRSSDVIHVARVQDHFKVVAYRIDAVTRNVRQTVYDLPESSDKIDFWGSGRSTLIDYWLKWSSSSDSETSRAVFGAFYDFLYSEADPSCSGPPQLIGLFDHGQPQLHGVWFSQRRFFLDREVPYDESQGEIQWRDMTFQRVSPKDGTLLPGAQHQPVPIFKPKFVGLGKIQNA
jgi:hypothetical protein